MKLYGSHQPLSSPKREKRSKMKTFFFSDGNSSTLGNGSFIHITSQSAYKQMYFFNCMHIDNMEKKSVVLGIVGKYTSPSLG